jgi:hypothetical protein
MNNTLFSLIDMTEFLASWCFPDSHIHVIGPTEDPGSIKRIFDIIDLLHSLPMVNFSWHPLISRKNTNSLVERTTDKLPTSRTISNRQNSLDVVFMDWFGLLIIIIIITIENLRMSKV